MWLFGALAAALLYGVNIYLFFVYFKREKFENDLDKLAILFGSNMSVALVDAVLLFLGALTEEGILML